MSTARELVELQREIFAESRATRGPVAHGAPWLGVILRPHGREGMFRYAVPHEKLASLCERLDEMTTPPSSRIDGSTFDLGRWLASINEQLTDWWQAYRFAENASDVFGAVDAHVQERVGQLLRSVLGQPWRQLREDYRRRLARGFETWEVGGTRLTVLAALPPHCPRGLVHRPPWMEWRRAAGRAAPRPPGEPHRESSS